MKRSSNRWKPAAIQKPDHLKNFSRSLSGLSGARLSPHRLNQAPLGMQGKLNCKNTMNETNHAPKSCVRRVSRETARIAIELEAPVHKDLLTPEIFKRAADIDESPLEPEGFTLSGISPRKSVAFVHVRSDDVIILRWKSPSGDVIACSYFKITRTFALTIMEPVPLNIPVAFAPSRKLMESDDGKLLHVQENAIQRLFTDRHPAWIQEPLDYALMQWRHKCPTLFLRVAPPSEVQESIALLVRYDPRRALAEYSGALDADQFQICMERNPEAAARYGFQQIPRADRIGLVRTYSTLALNHHLDRMTEMELEVAAGADAMTAFHLRHFLEGRRHAIVLSKSYPVAFFIAQRGAESELDGEVKQSVLEFPRIWHRTHYRSFGILFRSLACPLGIHFSGDDFLRLHEKLGAKLRKELQIHIGSRI